MSPWEAQCSRRWQLFFCTPICQNSLTDRVYTKLSFFLLSFWMCAGFSKDELTFLYNRIATASGLFWVLWVENHVERNKDACLEGHFNTMGWINSYCLPVLAKLQWHLDGDIIKKSPCFFCFVFLFVLNIRQILQFFGAKKIYLAFLCILLNCFNFPLSSHLSSWQETCFKLFLLEYTKVRLNMMSFQKSFLIKQHYRLRHLMNQLEISQI